MRAFPRCVLGIAALASFLAGCGGGSATPGGTTLAKTTAAPAAKGTGQVTFTITVPARTAAGASRGAQYVSGGGQSIAIGIFPVSGGIIPGSPSATINQDLTAVSPGCSGATPNVCSIAVAVPAGIAAFSMTLYSGTAETGSVLSQLDPTAATERTIVEGTSNVVVPLILNGVPSTITVSAPATTFQGGVAASVPYTVVAKDASGNTIIGADPYETAITPTASDAAAFSFSPATITSPTTAVTLQFNGNATSIAPTFGATAGTVSATPLSLAFSPAALHIACSGGCAGLANGSTPYALAVTEAGLTGNVTATASGTSCTADPASPSTASISSGSGSVNLYPNPVGGTCTVSVIDSYGQTATATAAFVAAGNPIVTSGCLATTLPPDPNGGFLYAYACTSTGVLYGSYYFEPLQSNQNPGNFQLAVYANPAKTFITQFTVGGTEYITGATISPPYVIFQGNAGLGWPAINFPITSLVP